MKNIKIKVKLEQFMMIYQLNQKMNLNQPHNPTIKVYTLNI